MYARLGFSVAAHVDPDVLIIDEVLSVGDYVFQQRCMDRIRAVINGGTTVLFVSHNLKAVTEICHECSAVGPWESARDWENGRRCTEVSEPRRNGRRSGMRTSQFTSRRFKSGTAEGEQATFESGQTAWVDIEVTSSRGYRQISCRYLVYGRNKNI